MKKKFICTVCGYIHEGDEAPEKCPLCGAPRSKFEELDQEALLQFVTEHVIGVAKDTDDEMRADLTAKLPRLSSVMLSRKQNMPLSLQNFWANVFGTPRQTLKSVWLPRQAQMLIKCV